MSTGPTWKDVAVRYPEFVQWLVAKFGPLPDGEIKKDDYDLLVAAYQEATW